jgi:hypothetical protein
VDEATEVLGDVETGLDKAFAYEGPLDIEAVCRIAERAEALKLRELRRYERSGEWRAEGFLSAASAIRNRCNMAHGAATAALQLGEKLEQLPETAAAFAAGEISRQHVTAIADACTPERIDALREVEFELVSLARQAKPKAVRAVVRRLADSLDGDDGASEDEAQLARRRLHASVSIGGMVVTDGQFDPEGGEIYLTALKAEMEADRQKNDARTPAMRRADALINICKRSLDSGEIKGTGGVRPHVTIVADAAELERRGGADIVEQVRADAAHVGRLSTATLRRITCDCGISRVITDGPSVVLDVGRTTRTIPAALRRALLVRDRHCQGKGCDRPGAWCDVHHIQHWVDGGPTNLENTKLLCRRCHIDEHLREALEGRAPP